MKPIFGVILTVLLLFFQSTAVLAMTSNQNNVFIHGEAAYLIDVQSGQTLFKKNGDQELPPASLTKIMTALLAIEQGNLNDSVTASDILLNSQIVYGTQIYLKPGEKMTLDDLLYAVLLNSANDAAVIVAEHIGDSLDNFIKMMNERARRIGALKTTFKNPSGLNEKGHLSTAHDLALIAKEAYQNPTFSNYVRTKSHVIAREIPDVPIEMFNENKLLWRDPNVDGIKTGYTSQAQNCLVASATKDGRQVIGVILKSPGREIYDDMENLLNYGFENYNNVIYRNSGSVVTSLLINNEPVDLILDKPILLT